MVGSANPYYHNVFNSWNNMQTIVNNTTIYDSLSAYFNEMLASPTTGMPTGRRPAARTSSTSSPRPPATR